MVFPTCAVLMFCVAAVPLRAAQLNSTEPRDIAWGAYVAGTYHETSAIPQLQRILFTSSRALDGERAAMIDAVLDALIQLSATVPASILRSYFERRPVQTLLLLAHTPDRDPVLVALLADATGSRWYGIANLLLRDTESGLAVRLLSALTLRLNIEVRDDHLYSGRGMGSSVGCWDGIGVNPPHFPPRAVYRLTSAAQPGALLLADGPRPVYYWRTLETSRQYGVGECSIGGPDDRDRMTYLNAFADFQAGAHLPRRPA